MKRHVNLLMTCVLILVMSACTQLATATPAVILPTPTVTQYAITPDLIAEIDAWLEELNKAGRFNGSVLIASKGTVLLSKGYGQADRTKDIPNTPQTRFRLGSITKQFTAMAILILQSQNKLNVQNPICGYLIDCPTAWKDITIHHLLTHTSGIPDFLQLNTYLDARVKHLLPGQVIELFRDEPLIFQPGERYSYSNSGYIVLGYIIEQVSGTPYEVFLQQSIFTALNLPNTGYEHDSSNLAVGYYGPYPSTPVEFIDMSVPYAAGALYSTVEDLYVWDQALYAEQLIPQELLDQMFARHTDTIDFVGIAYGYGWAVGEENGHPIHIHGGGVEGFRTVIARYPEDRATIIVLSNQESTDMMAIQKKISVRIFGQN